MLQYPGVARSIESDVENLLRLINTFNLLPEGLYAREAAEVCVRASGCTSMTLDPCKQCAGALLPARPRVDRGLAGVSASASKVRATEL